MQDAIARLTIPFTHPFNKVVSVSLRRIDAEAMLYIEQQPAYVGVPVGELARWSAEEAREQHRACIPVRLGDEEERFVSPEAVQDAIARLTIPFTHSHPKAPP